MSTKKKKKKGIDPSLIAPFPFLPGVSVPAVATSISHPNIPTYESIDWNRIREQPPSILYMAITDQYKQSIFYADDPADVRAGIGFALALNIAAIALTRSPAAPLGLAIAALPDPVAYAVGVAGSNIYQGLDLSTEGTILDEKFSLFSAGSWGSVV